MTNWGPGPARWVAVGSMLVAAIARVAGVTWLAISALVVLFGACLYGMATRGQR